MISHVPDLLPAGRLSGAAPRLTTTERHSAINISGSPRFDRVSDERLSDVYSRQKAVDVLACLSFPAQHRTKLHSTNPLERLNKEVKRRADVVGIFPNEESITRLIGAVLMEANDEWQLQQRGGAGRGQRPACANCSG